MSCSASLVLNGVRSAVCAALAALLVFTSATTANDKEPVLKFTAVELTSKFRDDKTQKLFLQYLGKIVEIEGEVRYSQRFATGNGWLLQLQGCKESDARVRMPFEIDNPDLPKAKKLAEGDKVAVRGTFEVNFGANVHLKNPRIVKGPSSQASADSTRGVQPLSKESAEKFVKDAVKDPKATEAKLKGKVIELTGAVSSADPRWTLWGFSLSAGKLKPSDMWGLFAECSVPETQLEKVWLLAKGQKVKVVGILTGVEKDRVRLTKCQVTELERNPMPTIRANDLAKSYAKNEAAASNRYGDPYNQKELFLEGVVKGAKETQYDTRIILEVSGKLGVQVGVDKQEAKALKQGDKLLFKATCRGVVPSERIVLCFGRALKQK